MQVLRFSLSQLFQSCLINYRNHHRKLQSQLEIHGVDYNAAAALAASAASSDFANEMVGLFEIISHFY